MSFEHISNERFEQLTKDGKTEIAFEQLFTNYKKFIRTCVSKYVHASKMEIEDLESIAYLEVWNAFLRFDPNNDRNCSFATYFTMFIKRKMSQVVKRQRRLCRNLMRSISLNVEHTENGKSIGDMIKDEKAEEHLLNTETQLLINDIVPILTDMQRKTFVLFMSGMKETEIAKELGQCRQMVNSRMNAVRNKVQKMESYCGKQAV